METYFPYTSIHTSHFLFFHFHPKQMCGTLNGVPSKEPIAICHAHTDGPRGKGSDLRPLSPMRGNKNHHYLSTTFLHLHITFLTKKKKKLTKNTSRGSGHLTNKKKVHHSYFYYSLYPNTLSISHILHLFCILLNYINNLMNSNN